VLEVGAGQVFTGLCECQKGAERPSAPGNFIISNSMIGNIGRFKEQGKRNKEGKGDKR